MLSKVITGRDTDRAQPVIFAPANITVAANYSQAQNSKKDEPSDREARLEAENLVLKQAVRRLEAELAAARRDSFDSGRRQGEQQTRLEMTPVLERMNASLADVAALRQEIRKRAENDVVQLSLLIAKRVLHRETTVDPGALNAIARVVFERLARAESYRVTVHPQFAEVIRSAIPPSQISKVVVQPDPSCALGTFVVRSEEGLVDASIDAQLEEIAHGLTDRLNHS